MQAPRSSPEPGAGASATTGLRQAAGVSLAPTQMQAPVPTAAQTSVTNAKILLSGNANGEVNAYPPLARPLERCDSLNSLLAKRKQAAASAFAPITASGNMDEARKDKEAGTLKKVRVTGSQTESDDDGTEPQDLEAGARSFGDNSGQYAAFKEPAPTLQLPGTVGVNPSALVPAPAPSTSITEPYVKRMPPRDLHKIGSKPIEILIVPENKKWFDESLLRVQYRPGKKYPLIRVSDVWRLAGKGKSQAQYLMQPKYLTKFFKCSEVDILMVDFDGTVSGRAQLVLGLNLYRLRNVAFF